MQKKHEYYLHKSRFIAHLTRNVLYGIFFVIFALFIGMLGYHFFEKMSWVDSFVNASMILSGMGPLTALTSSGGKIFAGCYALFSGLIFIAIVALVFSPIIHHIFYKIHLESAADLKKLQD